METTEVKARQSKYCTAIESLVAELGHATNQELLTGLRQDFPELSATTVHRATARLASRGQLAMAPLALDGSMRYDANLVPHDHFQCSNCYRLRDADVRDKVIKLIQESIEDCGIGGRLVITGVCKECHEFSHVDRDV